MQILQHFHGIRRGDENDVAQRLHLAAVATAQTDGLHADLFRGSQAVHDVRRIAAAGKRQGDVARLRIRFQQIGELPLPEKAKATSPAFA